MSVKFSERTDGTTLGLVDTNKYGVLPSGIGTAQLADSAVTLQKLAFALPTPGTTWTNGVGAPSGGADGNYYLDKQRGDIYVRASGTWTKVVDGLAGLPGVPVTAFTPAGVLTDSNFDAALRAAVTWCYSHSASRPDIGSCVNVLIPPGTWTLQAPITFPGTNSLQIPTPGIIGAGSESTTILVTFDSTEGAIVGGTDASVWTQFWHLEGFLLETNNGVRVGNGIHFISAFKPLVRDVIVRGFASSQDWRLGWGLFFEPSNVSPHQHVRLDNVGSQQNQGGLFLNNVAQLSATNVWINQNYWLDIAHDNVSGVIHAGTYQCSDLPSPATNRWYVGAKHPAITSGFNYTTGLVSGSGASLGVASFDGDGFGTCTVTNLTGLTAADKNRWLELTLSGEPNDDTRLISGVYQIVDVLSATSCTILKGTPHSATVSLAWQVRGHSGGTALQLNGFPYHEGDKRCLIFLGPEENSFGVYDFDGIFDANLATTAILDRVSYVTINSVYPNNGSGAGIIARTVSSLTTNMLNIDCDVDSFTRPGLIALAYDASYGVAGQWSGARSYTSRLNAFAKDRGIIAFDARRADKLTLSTNDIQQVRSLFDDSITLGPQNAGKYAQYVASDSGFGTAAFQMVGGLVGDSQNLQGIIASGKLPSGPYSPTWLVITRLPNTSTAVSIRRIYAGGAGNQYDVAMNDGTSGYATGNWFEMYDSRVGGGGNVQIRNTADILPHAYAIRWDGRANSKSGAGLASDELSYGAESRISNLTRNPSEYWPGNENINIWLNHDFGGGTSDLYVAWVGFCPSPLSFGEIDQFMDMAAAEFKVTR